MNCPSFHAVLTQLLACREWTEEGQLWVQYVSSTPATRLDVINLQEKLDQQLQQRQVNNFELHQSSHMDSLLIIYSTGKYKYRYFYFEVWTLADHIQYVYMLYTRTGTRDWHLPSARGALCAMLWWADTSGYHQLRRAWPSATSSQRWDEDDDCCLSSEKLYA